MKISKTELREMVRKVVKDSLVKENYFRTAQLKQDMDGLALEFLEKVVSKLGIDPESLTPEAEAVFVEAHEQLREAVKAAASRMVHLGAIVKAAKGDE